MICWGKVSHPEGRDPMQGPASVEARIEPHEASRPGKEALATWVGALFAFSTFVLAAVACLGSSVLVIRVLSSPEQLDRVYSAHAAVTSTAVVAALLLLIGAIKHLKRKRSGAVMIAVAAVILVAIAVLQGVWVATTGWRGEIVFAQSGGEVLTMRLSALLAVPGALVSLWSRQFWLSSRQPAT